LETELSQQPSFDSKSDYSYQELWNQINGGVAYAIAGNETPHNMKIVRISFVQHPCQYRKIRESVPRMAHKIHRR
jgi:hypothetical protein